ncbi:hypothetical protein SNEBB_008499 [Seison nebaliae]|nr:hypothetical protein SNEBB_008499 [Seison nebaliae]
MTGNNLGNISLLTIGQLESFRRYVKFLFDDFRSIDHSDWFTYSKHEASKLFHYRGDAIWYMFMSLIIIIGIFGIIGNFLTIVVLNSSKHYAQYINCIEVLLKSNEIYSLSSCVNSNDSLSSSINDTSIIKRNSIFYNGTRENLQFPNRFTNSTTILQSSNNYFCDHITSATEFNVGFLSFKSSWLCKIVEVVRHTAYLSSCWFVVAFTIERFIITYYPMKILSSPLFKPKNARLICIIIFLCILLSQCYHAIIFSYICDNEIVYNLIKKQDTLTANNTVTTIPSLPLPRQHVERVCRCRVEKRYNYVHLILSTYGFRLVGIFVLPVLLIWCLNTAIMCRIKFPSEKFILTRNSTDRNIKRKKKVNKRLPVIKDVKGSPVIVVENYKINYTSPTLTMAPAPIVNKRSFLPKNRLTVKDKREMTKASKMLIIISLTYTFLHVFGCFFELYKVNYMSQDLISLMINYRHNVQTTKSFMNSTIHMNNNLLRESWYDVQSKMQKIDLRFQKLSSNIRTLNGSTQIASFHNKIIDRAISISHIELAFDLIVNINYSINFFLYIVMLHTFRGELKELLHKSKLKKLYVIQM